MSTSDFEALTAGPTGDPDPATGKPSVNCWPLLSDEAVLIIFRLLPQKDLVTVSLVDRRFSQISKDPSLWTQLTLDVKNILLNAESCRELVDRCKKLDCLEITKKYGNFSNHIDTSIINMVMRAVESLKSLKVDHSLAEWTPVAMAKLGSMKNLTRLSLSFAFASDSNSVRPILAGAEMLEELKNLDQLEVLTLVLKDYNLSGKSYDESYGESYEVLERVFQQLKKLKEVKLYPCVYGESLVIALAENNPDLKVIRGMNFSSLSDETIEVLVNSCPGLEEFFISSGYNESTINKLSSSLPNLKCLEVRGPSVGVINLKDEKLIEFAEKFRSLQSLTFRHYSYVNVTDTGIERLVNTAEKLKYLSLLAPQVTEDLVKRLRAEYPNLELSINNYQ